MGEVLENDQRHELHPEEIAALFQVHLRTVFRWFKNGYLLLDSSETLRGDPDKVMDALQKWMASCTRTEARKSLKVAMIRTITSWIKKGVLETVTVCGSVRVRLDSIERVKLLPEYQPGRKKILLNRHGPHYTSQINKSQRARKTELPADIVVLRSAVYRRVYTLDKAACVLRMSNSQVKELFDKGIIRGTTLDNGGILLFIHSVESYKQKLFNKSSVKLTRPG